MNGKPSTEWAEKLWAKHCIGEKLSTVQIEMAKRCLLMNGKLTEKPKEKSA